jgi:hypothetical protein
MKHTAAEHFWTKVDTSAADGCWPWTAYRLPDHRGVRGNGYRRFGLIGSTGWRLVLAHRVTWTFTHGDNPEGSAIAVEASVASTYTAAVGGQLTHHVQKIYLGLFDTAEEAAAIEALDIIPDGIRAARAAAHRFSTEQLALIVLTDTSDRVNANAALILACALQRLAAQQ